MRVEFAREGLGYVMSAPEIAVELTVPSLVRSRGEWFGELDVACGLPGIRSSDGQLHRARFNFSSSTARATLARDLAARAAVPDLDWREVLEIFCRRILTAVNEGEPIVLVGNRPQRIAPRWTVEPILAAQTPTIIYGEGGSGKSTLALALAVAVETGIATVPGLHPLPASVLYLDWETGPDDVDEKVKGIVAGARIEGPVEMRYRFCSGPFADQVEDIARQVTDHAIGLVVIDSVGLAAGTSSDGSDAAESALRLFSSFRLLRATVLAIDHIAKSDANEPTRASRPYGSIYKTNLARATFELRRADGSGNRSSLALYNTKTNVGRKLAPIGIWVEHDDDGRIRYGREDVTGELMKPLTLADQIADVLRSGARPPRDIAEVLDVEDNRVRSTLHKGKGKRFVDVGGGLWGNLSHAG